MKRLPGDGLGRVWQRWNYDSSIEEWDSTVTRYVYDGALAQEHLFDVSSPMGEWIYAYSRLTHDYLRQPAGIRDRVHPAQGADTDYFLLGARRREKRARSRACATILPCVEIRDREFA